jgi:hypothetical protein
MNTKPSTILIVGIAGGLIGIGVMMLSDFIVNTWGQQYRPVILTVATVIGAVGLGFAIRHRISVDRHDQKK